jgi:UDP:flavonoid glycosyltransferase YjiC (YdhE family)
MRAVLTSFGTTGDVLPFLALAVELRRHGHEPVLAYPPYYHSLAERFNMEFVPIGPDLQAIQSSITIALHTMPETVAEMHALFAPLATALPQMYTELHAACHSADVLISGPMQPASRMVHETTGIPFVSSQGNHFGGGGSLAFQQATAALINPVRAQLGLQPLDHPVTRDANSPQLALYAMSRHLSPAPRDWPAHYHMTGFFFLDDEQWQPDAALTAFVAAGEPAVVVTFGSMTHEDPDALTELLLAAIQQAGRRAIIQQGWSGLAQQTLPPNIHVISFVPHAWLFSHAACVVHHGGTGTTAAALRAGVPSIFVPHTFDQPIWAALAHSLGYAGPPLPYQELTADRLAAAISATLTTPRYQQVATDLSEKIRAEQGVTKARRLIEQLVHNIGLHQAPPAAPQRDHSEPDDLEQKVARRKQYQHTQRLRKRDKPMQRESEKDDSIYGPS